MARDDGKRVLSDALRVAVNELEKHPAPGTQARKRARVIAERLVSMAEDGDIAAISMVFDRLEGKAVQPVAGRMDTTFSVVIAGLGANGSHLASQPQRGIHSNAKGDMREGALEVKQDDMSCTKSALAPQDDRDEIMRYLKG